MGFRGLGFRVSRFRAKGLGFRGLGFTVSRLRVWGFTVLGLRSFACRTRADQDAYVMRSEKNAPTPDAFVTGFSEGSGGFRVYRVLVCGLGKGSLKAIVGPLLCCDEGFKGWGVRGFIVQCLMWCLSEESEQGRRDLIVWKFLGLRV